MKIIYCGFFKTASRSIGDFIHSVSGYNAYAGRSIDLHTHPTHCKVGDGDLLITPDDMQTCCHNGTVDNPKIYEYLKENDDMIGRDFPYFGMYKHINETYDDSKFIMCIRETESLINSYKKHDAWLLPIARNKGNAAILGVNGSYDDKYKERLRMVYESHNHKVLNYFKDKPGKLLVLKFEDIGTEKFEKDILDFLGLENPNNIKIKWIK
jgi:hypothetical protein